MNNPDLRADLERFTGHGLLDCHAICDQRDAALARAERAEADTVRLDWIESEAGKDFLNSGWGMNWREWYMRWYGTYTYINRTSLDQAMKEARK